MVSGVVQNRISANRLLAALPPAEYERLASSVEHVTLSAGKVLHEAGEPIESVYFPERGIISLICVMEDGSTTEVGAVGSEGVAGISVCLGSTTSNMRSLVSLAGEGWRLDAGKLAAVFREGGVLQDYLMRYMQFFLVQTAQNVGCNTQHTLEKRLARWLLAVCDRLQTNEIFLTQEFISQMLGTRRPTVTVAAGMLQERGVIRYARGKILVLDRAGLEAAACECYGVVRDEYQRYIQGLSS